jgi:hypothetical protein
MFVYVYFRPTSGCLQYVTGLTGRLTTFNFNQATVANQMHLGEQTYVVLIFLKSPHCLYDASFLGMTCVSDKRRDIVVFNTPNVLIPTPFPLIKSLPLRIQRILELTVPMTISKFPVVQLPAINKVLVVSS